MQHRPSEYAYSTDPTDRDYLNLMGIRIPGTDIELVDRFGRLGALIKGDELARQNGEYSQYKTPRRLAETIEHISSNDSDSPLRSVRNDNKPASYDDIARDLILNDYTSPYYVSDKPVPPSLEYYWEKTREEDDAQQDALNQYALAEWARNLVAKQDLMD